VTIKTDLQNYVTSRVPVMNGTVEVVSDNSIIVSSRAGRKEFQVPDVSQFSVGDRVKFQGNTYLGRTPVADGLVYVV
jgi:hypothetical protein